MAMRGGGRRGSGQVIGKAALLIELKNRILATLHKLSDRDTQQVAVEELERIAQNLTAEGIALFLTCLYDTDAQQKSVVRRECIRLVGTLASLHGNLLACHLPKMVGNIMRRLKDPDSNIRDACVDTMGVLASCQIGAVDVFVKPLLEALAEQHRNLQTGAALCLARVIECIKDVHALTPLRLCSRVVKMLASPNFLAKASLLTVVGVMVQVPGVVSSSQLPVLLASVQEELECSEWAVRKAAADTLSSMALDAGSALGSYRRSVLASLENGRFDKVKPVRDGVSEALQLWKALYDPNASQESASPTRFFDGDVTPPRRNSLLMKSRASMYSSFSGDTCGRPKSMPDSRRASTVRKRASGLGEKKANPDFFRKLEDVRDSIDWQFEVAVPRDSPLERSPRAASNEHYGSPRAGSHEHHGSSRAASCTDTIVEAAAFPPPSVCGGGETLELISIKVHGGVPHHHEQEEASQFYPPEVNGEIACNGYQDAAESADTLSTPATCGESQVYGHQNNGERGSQSEAYGASGSRSDANGACGSQSDAYGASGSRSDANGACGSQSDTNGAYGFQSDGNGAYGSQSDANGAYGFQLDGNGACGSQSDANGAYGFQLDGNGACGSQSDANGAYGSQSDANGAYGSQSDANGAYGCANGACGSQSDANRSCGSQSDINGACDDKTALDMISIHRHFHSLERQQLSIMEMVQDSMVRVHESIQDLEQRVSGLEHIVNDIAYNIAERTNTSTNTPVDFQYQYENPEAQAPSVVDSVVEKMTESTSGGDSEDISRRPNLSSGEGPSARSVWHASKDEAIAAIRGASTPRKLHNARSKHSNGQKTQQRVAGGPFWMMWSRAMESVRSGDLDAAYGEILGSSDELLLVRLMGSTGPVLEQLGAATVAHLLGRVKQFLQQQSFLDSIIPWLQQVTDLVSSKGPSALGLEDEIKKDLVFALQEATSVDYAQSGMAAKIAQLAEHLRNAWF